MQYSFPAKTQKGFKIIALFKGRKNFRNKQFSQIISVFQKKDFQYNQFLNNKIKNIN